jgi:hypothetical protein
MALDILPFDTILSKVALEKSDLATMLRGPDRPNESQSTAKANNDSTYRSSILSRLIFADSCEIHRERPDLALPNV